MTPRMRRLESDFKQIQKDFVYHKNIVVTPIGEQPVERYHVTYYVNGIYMQPDGNVQMINRHEVEITLHADYPRYKPICQILTPIWHPNFRDGQICIGDIWGAGESLTDIIINIGDMIQYRSWNSYSPLSADAAAWAMNNKHMFPVGNVDLYIPDPEAARAPELSAKEPTIEVDSAPDPLQEPVGQDATNGAFGFIPASQRPLASPENTRPETGNDIDIFPEDLMGIEYIPAATRMQSAPRPVAKGGRINLKTILFKGLIWALVGALIGFVFTDFIAAGLVSDSFAAKLLGHDNLADYYEYSEKADASFEKFFSHYKEWCKNNGYDSDTERAFERYYTYGMTTQSEGWIEDYIRYDELADEELYDSFLYEFDEDFDAIDSGMSSVLRLSSAIWSALLAMFVGLALGIGEGVYYGSWKKGAMYGLLGALVSFVIGFASGYLGQWMYAEMLSDSTSDFTAALVRGLGWAIMGLGVGVAVGLIRPNLVRVACCALGGLIGGFLGGFVFNYICDVIPGDMVARGVGIVIMGLLIGLGVGLLEQATKSAWLKVVRGEFEGKEYLVFTGVTSIGNNASNTIVLFKDKLVAPHHCDIRQEGRNYVLLDSGTHLGTIVNGQRINRHVLRQNDAIAIGNSVLIFNLK